MSCDNRRKHFLSAVAGSGSAAAAALGGAETAQQVLEQVFRGASDNAQLTPPDAPGRTLAEARTRALFSQFKAKNIPVPSHSVSGLPNRASQVGYSVLHQTLDALAKRQPVPVAARAIIERETQRRISAVARDGQGRQRCANCGQFARPDDHLCRQTATADALRSKLGRTFGVPASAYPTQALDGLIQSAKSSEGLTMRHGLSGEPVTVALDGLALALANGFTPDTWHGANAATLVELPGGRVVPVINAAGLTPVVPVGAVSVAAAASGTALPTGTPVTTMAGPLPTPTVAVAIGTATSVTGGTAYDRGRFFGTEFKKLDARGQSVVSMGETYTVGAGSRFSQDWSTARRTRIEPPPMHGEVIAGRTLITAVGLLAEGAIAETDSGQIEIYGPDGSLQAVYDPSANTVGDTEGTVNASGAQMAAVLAYRALHPETPEDAALAADLVRLKAGAATPLGASDAAYIALKNGVFNKAGTLTMGGAVTAGKCPDCGQFTGSAAHVCRASSASVAPASAETNVPANMAGMPDITVNVEAPNVTASVEAPQITAQITAQIDAPQITAQMDAEAFAQALKDGMAGLAPSAPAAVASGDLTELRDAMAEMAKAVSALASGPVAAAPPPASATDDRLVAILEKLAGTTTPAPQAPAATPAVVAPSLPRAQPARTAPLPTAEGDRTQQEGFFARVRRAEPDPSLSSVDPRMLDASTAWTAENIPAVDPDYYVNDQSAAIMKSMAAVIEAGAAGNKANRTRAFSIYGPPGTGKNKLLEQVAASIQTVDAAGNLRQGMHYEEVDIYPDSDPEKLIGGTVIVSDGKGGTETKVRLGPIGQAVAMGSVVALNEVVRNPRMLTAFQSMLEKGYFQVDAPELGIVRIPVHPATVMAMTWNPGLEGDGDRPAQAPLSRTIPFKLDRATPEEQGAQVNAYFATFPETMRPSEIETRTAVAFTNAVTDLVYGNEVGRLSKRSKCVPGPRELSNFVLLGKQVGWETALGTMKVYCDQNSDDYKDQWNLITLAYEMQFGEIGTDGAAMHNPPAQV